jgi:hypothetical protein
VDRIPVEARLSAPVQAHPASYTIGTWSFSGGKATGACALNTHRPLAPRLNKEEYYTLWAFGACSRVNFTFTFTFTFTCIEFYCYVLRSFVRFCLISFPLYVGVADMINGGRNLRGLRSRSCSHGDEKRRAPVGNRTPVFQVVNALLVCLQLFRYTQRV